MRFFGFTTQPPKDGKPMPAQPRWAGTEEEPMRAVIDIDEAYREVGDVLQVWRATSAWSDAAPFSGGVWDAWPQRVAQGLAFLKAETRAVQSYLMEVTP